MRQARELWQLRQVTYRRVQLGASLRDGPANPARGVCQISSPQFFPQTTPRPSLSQTSFASESLRHLPFLETPRAPPLRRRENPYLSPKSPDALQAHAD